MAKSIIIIGGGLSGLSTGCYGRMNGYDTTIFEMHKITGGVCTGWKRKGYTIDGSMHWLLGTGPGQSFHKFWEELGAAQQWQVYNHDRFMSVESADGGAFTFYTDADRLERHMKEVAPEDNRVIQEFIKAVRSLAGFELPADKAPELYSLLDNIKMARLLPFVRLLRKWDGITTSDYARRFKNPLLRHAFGAALGDEGYPLPMLFLLMTLGWLHQRNGGYVIGGSPALNGYIQQRYLDLGGRLNLRARVAKILVENDRAVGIRLADGTEHRADTVVSTADGRTTIFDMLDGRYLDGAWRACYENPTLFPPLVYIGLGVNRRFDDVPPAVGGLTFPLHEPIEIGGRQYRQLEIILSNFDPSMAPEGKTVVRAQFMTDYDYWEKLHQEPERYRAEKERIADEVVARLDRRFPGLAAQVEMRDVATPMTWVRYTGNWRGSYEGWLPSSRSFTKGMRKTLPGLGNFFMAGMWVNPGGGMTTAVMSGRNTVQLICKQDKRPFVTSKP